MTEKQTLRQCQLTTPGSSLGVVRVTRPPSLKVTCAQYCSRCCPTCRCEQRPCSSLSAASVLHSMLGAREVPNISVAAKIAEAPGVRFPVVSTWRPKDVYAGIGQLDAMLELLRIKAQYNCSEQREVRRSNSAARVG